MAEKEELGSAVSITNLQISSKGWGDDSGSYSGTLSFKIGGDDDKVDIKINHAFCKTVLENSYKELKHVIQTHGTKMILDILNADNPISKSKQEIEDEQKKRDSDSDESV